MRSLIVAAVAAICLTGCPSESAPPTAKQEQSSKAQAAADSIRFAENAEIDNIKARLELTANPGLLGYVILLNEMGQPVMYTGVKGKITSGSKRLTPTFQLKNMDCGQYPCTKDLPAPSDEGTYGSSGEYIFFWTPAGQFIQWNGKYLYSDNPFRLKVEPVVMNVQEVKP